MISAKNDAKKRKSLFRRAAFWLPALSLLVVWINLSGADEYNILFFVTSPPAWIAETGAFLHPSEIPMPVYYVSTVLIWLLVGAAFDLLLSRLRGRFAGKTGRKCH